MPWIGLKNKGKMRCLGEPRTRGVETVVASGCPFIRSELRFSPARLEPAIFGYAVEALTR